MADVVDMTDETESILRDKQVAAISAAAANIPKGRAGDCFYCGDHFERLVGEPPGCGRCRDKRHLP